MIKLTLKTHEPTKLEVEIDRLFAQLQEINKADTEEYNKVADQLAKLYKLKEIDSKKRVSPDAVAAALTNLAGIVLILNYEHAHVITTKAVSFVGRLVK